MNEVVSSFLSVGEKFIPERHLRQNQERIQKLKETGYSRSIYQNELDKTCFHQDMAHGDFKDLSRRTGSQQACDREFYATKNSKHDNYQRRIAGIVYKFFNKKSGGTSTYRVLKISFEN